jgi:hypothetical protein
MAALVAKGLSGRSVAGLEDTDAFDRALPAFHSHIR